MTIRIGADYDGTPSIFCDSEQCSQTRYEHHDGPIFAPWERRFKYGVSWEEVEQVRADHLATHVVQR